MAHKLAPFFQVKLGTTFTRTLTTGERSSRDAYARHYTLLVTVARLGNVEFHVSSFDLCPSGVRDGGTEREQGTVKVGFGGKNGLEDVLSAAVIEADPDFHEKCQEALAS